jgi:membrane protease subunit (stomatin/prohibitin family)
MAMGQMMGDAMRQATSGQSEGGQQQGATGSQAGAAAAAGQFGYCPKCGNPLPESAKFCPNCGNPLS